MMIEPTSAPLGATVTGLDIKNVSRGDAARLYQAFLDHGVLAFKRMDLDIAGHIALTEIFGETERDVLSERIRHKESPELIVLAANGGKPVAADDPEADKIIGEIPWHTDGMYTDTPYRGALLRAVTVPAVGGDTGFIDTAGVYRDLPCSIKCKLQGLRIVHRFEETYRLQSIVSGEAERMPGVLQPLVSVHPETDMPVLNISPSTTVRIVGLPEDEGKELLAYLIDFATREERAYIHHWETGDVVLWDNWRTMHRAYGHPKKYLRVVERTTLKSTMRMGRTLNEDKAHEAAV